MNGVSVQNDHRAQAYWLNWHGRRGQNVPANFEPVFDLRGFDVSDLTWPVPLQELTPFEEKNQVGVYVYTWCQEGDEGYARLIRAPERPFDEEVQMLLYKGHYLLVTRFAALMRLAGPHAARSFMCHRCLYTTEDERTMAEHLAKRDPCCTDLHSVRYSMGKQPNTAILPKGEQAILRFKNHHLRHDQPIMIYADFECYQRAGDVPRGSQTTVKGEMAGTSSYGYFVVPPLLQKPAAHLHDGEGRGRLREGAALLHVRRERPADQGPLPLHRKLPRRGVQEVQQQGPEREDSDCTFSQP